MDLEQTLYLLFWDGMGLAFFYGIYVYIYIKTNMQLDYELISSFI